MNMFEYIDFLKRPYDIFLFDSDRYSLPTHAHWHYYTEILYVLAGCIDVECDNHSYRLTEDNLIFIYPKSIHSIDAVSNGKIQYAVIKFDLNELYLSRMQNPWLRNIYNSMQQNPAAFQHFTKDLLMDYPVYSLVMSCLSETDSRKFGYNIQVQATINMLLVTLIRIWQENGLEISSNTTPLKDPSFFDHIIEYIDDHSHEKLSVQELAQKSNMSYPSFARNFKKMYGRSCNEYLEYIRANKAHDMLLYTDYSLNYISNETGFYDCSHFIRTYKKIMGITPNHQRKQGH